MADHGLPSEVLRDLSANGGSGNARWDMIDFRVSIPASGAITQPGAEKLRNEYDYDVREIFASMTGAGNTANAATADTQYDDVDEIRFNVKVSGTGENMFSTDVELQGLVDSLTGRSTRSLKFDEGGFMIRAGADLTASFTRRATTITTARIVNVYIVARLVPKDFYKTPRRT